MDLRMVGVESICRHRRLDRLSLIIVFTIWMEHFAGKFHFGWHLWEILWESQCSLI